MNFILFRPHLHRKPRADSSPVFVFGCASDKVVDKTTRRRGGESRSPRGRVGGGDVIGRDREGPQGWPFFGGKRKKNKQTKQTNKQTGVIFFFFYLLFVSSVGMLEVFVSSEGSQSRFVEDRGFFSFFLFSSYVSGIAT
jgi:hypothetical protein